MKAEEKIIRATVRSGSVYVTWGDKHVSEFNGMWLHRSSGFHAREKMQVKSYGLVPKKVKVTNSGNLLVEWDEQNIADTEHEASWLRAHCYSACERERRRRPMISWAQEIEQELPVSVYPDIISDNEARLRCFEQVLDYGFSIVREVTATPGTLLRVAELFGLVVPSPYADDLDQPQIENIRANLDGSVNTRKADFLAPHTDTCWRSSLSGLIYLHCLAQHSLGGETLLVDGVYLAERMRTRFPKSFKTLSETPLSFSSNVSVDDEWQVFGRVISLDHDGNVSGVRYSGGAITQLDLPAQLIEPVCHALDCFEKVLFDEKFWLYLKLAPCDLIVIDNQRVLHGRTAFDPTKCVRHLQTCSTRRDEFHNRYRALCHRMDRIDNRRELLRGVI